MKVPGIGFLLLLVALPILSVGAWRSNDKFEITYQRVWVQIAAMQADPPGMPIARPASAPTLADTAMMLSAEIAWELSVCREVLRAGAPR